MDIQSKQRFIRETAAKAADDLSGGTILWCGKMIGAIENSICPLCGGGLESGLANIPFILEDTIVVVKNAPALICTDCYEPYLDGPVTDQVMSLLTQLQTLHSEVSVISYAEPTLV